MTTWYKIAKLDTFLDRNRLNERIKSFKILARKLKYLQKYVFQNAPHAKTFVEGLAKDKRMSSFPHIVQKLLKASEVALDNYKTFSNICLDIMDDVVKEVGKMEKQRNEFVKKVKEDKDE